MTQPTFDVIFRGDILPGHTLVDVKRQLANLFRADEDKINSLFCGAAVPLKRNLDKVDADKYLSALRKAGADVKLVAAGSVRAAPSRRRRQVAGQERGVDSPRTLQQRLAAQSTATEQEKPSPQDNSASGSALYPPASDLLQASERAPQVGVTVDASTLSLRPQEGNLVDREELFRQAPVVVPERDFGLREAGADLLLDSEKQQAAAVSVKVPDVGLAPVGSDLGQQKSAPPPPPPDTSGLSVEAP